MKNKSGVKRDLGVPTKSVGVADKKAPKPNLDPNEICFYCKNSYKAMPIYTLAKAAFGKKPQIYVCHTKLIKSNRQGDPDRWVEVFDCIKKAAADGYIHRPDLRK